MNLVRNFSVSTSLPKQLELSWNQPINFNMSDLEILVTRTTTHYPVELFNPVFPTKATDSRPIEIFRAKTIVGLTPGTISVVGSVLTDTSATFPTSPNLVGRILRDASGQLFKIISNTTTTVTLNGTPTNGKYIILADFPTEIRIQQTFENDIRTSAGSGFIKDLVIVNDGNLSVVEFEIDELANLILQDANGDRFIIKNNNSNTIFLYESNTPQIGNGVSILSSSSNGIIIPYLDNYNTDLEASFRLGTGLLENQFYYYTAFVKPTGTNVAQAIYSSVDSGTSTQNAAISLGNIDFGKILYEYWPGIFRELDSTGDLEDLMKVFGFQFSEIYSLIKTYNLQSADTVFANALVPFAEQSGLPTVNFTIGADTLRRIANEMITAWKLKGSKEGIALFIRILTTWDITNGTGDFSGAISDFLPNVEALRFFDPALGSTNTRLTQTDPFVSGGRFVLSLPGIVIPGFFTFREFVVNIPNVALFIGESELLAVSNNTTTMTDNSANFGSTNSLVGNFLLPNQEEINDTFEIISNTSTTITVRGIANNLSIGGNYVVLSPLNSNRFSILNKLLPLYISFSTKAGFRFLG